MFGDRKKRRTLMYIEQKLGLWPSEMNFYGNLKISVKCYNQTFHSYEGCLLALIKDALEINNIGASSQEFGTTDRSLVSHNLYAYPGIILSQAIKFFRL